MLFFDFNSMIGSKVIAKKMPLAVTQKIGEELLTPILSIFEVMLQIKATISISLGPFSRTRALNGARKPLCLSLRLRIYEPKTIKIIPSKPYIFGNS